MIENVHQLKLRIEQLAGEGNFEIALDLIKARLPQRFGPRADARCYASGLCNWRRYVPASVVKSARRQPISCQFGGWKMEAKRRWIFISPLIFTTTVGIRR